MNKIKRVSVFFKWVFIVLLIALPLIQFVGWIYAPESFRVLLGFVKISVIPQPYTRPDAILHTLSMTEKMLGFIVSMVPVAIQMLTLVYLIKLFELYKLGEIFSLKNVKYIRNIGYTLLVGELIEPFYQFVMGLVLTLNNPHGHRFAAITLDQTNVGIVLMALLVILISWIMAEGYQLREDQQLTI